MEEVPSCSDDGLLFGETTLRERAPQLLHVLRASQTTGHSVSPKGQSILLEVNEATTSWGALAGDAPVRPTRCDIDTQGHSDLVIGNLKRFVQKEHLGKSAWTKSGPQACIPG